MPFKSQAQARKMFLLQGQHKLAPGTAQRWATETPNLKDLPERTKPVKAVKRLLSGKD